MIAFYRNFPYTSCFETVILTIKNFVKLACAELNASDSRNFCENMVKVILQFPHCSCCHSYLDCVWCHSSVVITRKVVDLTKYFSKRLIFHLTEYFLSSNHSFCIACMAFGFIFVKRCFHKTFAKR